MKYKGKSGYWFSTCVLEERTPGERYGEEEEKTNSRVSLFLSLLLLIHLLMGCWRISVWAVPYKYPYRSES